MPHGTGSRPEPTTSERSGPPDAEDVDVDVNSLTHDDLGSAAQRERRTRILDATIALASKGGFDAVQMRAVAERADVALGTLYRYFPSKIHLLVSALGRAVRARPPPSSRSGPSPATPRTSGSCTSWAARPIAAARART